MVLKFPFVAHIALWLFWVANGCWQPDAFAFSQWITDDLTKTVSGQTTAIQQDETGFVWIGTEYGVLRYDGDAFQRASEVDTTAAWLDYVPIHYLTLDTRGDLWIVSQEGLVVYKGPGSRFEKVDALAALDITVFEERAVDQFWVGTANGLYLFDASSNKLELVQGMGTHHASITSVVEDSQARLWVGTSAGLNLLDTETNQLVKTVNGDNEPITTSVSFIMEDDAGKIWVGTKGEGLFRVTLEGAPSVSNTALLERIDGIPTDRLTDGIKDAQGNFLLGTLQEGVIIWDPRLQQARSFPEGDPEDSSKTERLRQAVSVLFLDKTGILWVGMSEGVKKYPWEERRSLVHENERFFDQLELKQVKSIARAARGDIWIGTYGQGVLQVSPHDKRFKWHVHDPLNDNSLLDNRVISLEVDKSQNVWIATHTGLSRYDSLNDVYSFYFHEEESNHVVLQEIFVSRENEILVATANNGILQYNPLNDQFEQWTAMQAVEEGRMLNYVRHIIEDNTGMLWLAAGFDGLIGIDQDESIMRTIRDGSATVQMIRGQEVISVARGLDGTIWAGTLGGGVFRITPDSDQAVQITKKDGLPGNEVSCVLEDRAGFIWIVTRNGVARIDPESDDIIRFDRHDGLLYDQAHYNACMREESTLYLGNDEGVKLIDTDKLVVDKIGPRVELVDVQVWGKPHPFSHTSRIITLEQDQNTIELKFMIPDFLNPDENALLYRFGGEEDAWQEAGAGHRVTLSEIKSGTHHLQVKGANHSGVWGPPVSYELRVGSFRGGMWDTSMAVYVALFLVVGLLVRMHYRHKSELNELKRRLEDQGSQSAENVRSQIARDLHDDLGADLSRLVLSLENRLQRSDLSDFSRAWTRECWDYAQRITREVRHLSWAVDPERNWLTDLVDRIYREAYETFEMDKVEFRTSRIPRVFLPPAVRKDIFLIFREALTNIANHASAEEIRVYVNYKEDLLELTIEDNGVGFDPALIKAGNGLNNMRRRAQNLNARLAWENGPEGGTKVFLEVPLN